MSDFDRRRFLKNVLGQLVGVAGGVVVASAAASVGAATTEHAASTGNATDIQERADRLALSGEMPTDVVAAANEFLNGAFRNTPLGGFGNGPLGGFRNTPLGRFANGPFAGFRNTPLSTFGNGGWPNGAWGGFRNGGWPNGVWRNW